MKVEKLIRELKKMPPQTEVCIFDYRKNLHHASDEPQSHGIESNFEINHETENVSIPFCALTFKNDDYQKDGSPHEGSSIVYQAQRVIYEATKPVID